MAELTCVAEMRVDIFHEGLPHGTNVPLNECFPDGGEELDQACGDLAATGEARVGGGAAPLMILRLRPNVRSRIVASIHRAQRSSGAPCLDCWVCDAEWNELAGKLVGGPWLGKLRIGNTRIRRLAQLAGGRS